MEKLKTLLICGLLLAGLLGGAIWHNAQANAKRVQDTLTETKKALVEAELANESLVVALDDSKAQLKKTAEVLSSREVAINSYTQKINVLNNRISSLRKTDEIYVKWANVELPPAAVSLLNEYTSDGIDQSTTGKAGSPGAATGKDELQQASNKPD